MSYLTSFSNPEQVLKAAEELQNLNKEVAAYESLYNYMVSNRAKPWSGALEKIILLLIEISLKNRRTNTVSLSEPLRNYKSVTQHNNIGSLEMVLEKYCSMAEEILEKTAKKMDYRKLLDDEDIEESDNAELYISSVSSDSSNEKEELKAAWRLVWDTYRTTIDSISRHNRLEVLYQKTTEKALEFCKKYNRKNEAKRLFEAARNNLTNLLKNMEPGSDMQKFPFVIDLSNPDTNEIQITMRLNQLQYAYHFELWQEAIRALEDINKIMQKSERAIKPRILSEYFENLAKMFWKSEFYLYHAHAFFSHFSLCKSKSRLSAEELKAKSSYLVLSVLSIPPIQAEQDQSDDARNKALSLLSSSSTSPSKEDLVAYLMRHNIVDFCAPEVRELYFVMENSNDVVSLAEQVEAILDKLSQNKDLGIFKSQIQNVVVYKVLTVISKIYKTIKIEKLKRFIGSVPYSVCENILQHVAISGFIKIRIDHGRNHITFHDKSDDLQNMTMKISSISEEVQEVMSMLESRLEEANESALRKKLREEAELFVKSAEKNLKERNDIINNLRKGEEQKSKIEEQTALKQQQISQEQEQKEREEKKKRDQDAEKKKLIEKELSIVDTQKRQKLVAEIKGAKTAKINGKKIADYTEDELMSMSLDVLEEARDKLRQEEKAKEESKLKNLFKKVDYIERAKREETLKLLKDSWKDSQSIREEILKRHKEVFDVYQERKKILLNVKVLKEGRVKEILDQRKAVYENEFETFINKVKKEFQEKILAEARESLQQHKKKLEEAEGQKQALAEAERKRIEKEQKEKAERDKAAAAKDGLQRSNIVRNQGTVPTNQPSNTGISDSKAPSIVGRSNITRADNSKEPPKDSKEPPKDIGISRNTDGITRKVPEEIKDPGNKFIKGMGDKPRFITTKEIKKDDQPQPSSNLGGGIISRNTTTISTKDVKEPVKDEPKGIPKRSISGATDSNPVPNKFVRNPSDKKDGDKGGKSSSSNDGFQTVTK